jgi:hypothetical protein
VIYDPHNPYKGPQDDGPVTWRDFIPLFVGIAILVFVFAAILLQ